MFSFWSTDPKASSSPNTSKRRPTVALRVLLAVLVLFGRLVLVSALAPAPAPAPVAPVAAVSMPMFTSPVVCFSANPFSIADAMSLASRVRPGSAQLNSSAKRCASTRRVKVHRASPHQQAARPNTNGSNKLSILAHILSCD